MKHSILFLTIIATLHCSASEGEDIRYFKRCVKNGDSTGFDFTRQSYSDGKLVILAEGAGYEDAPTACCNTSNSAISSNLELVRKEIGQGRTRGKFTLNGYRVRWNHKDEFNSIIVMRRAD